jgi:hypothetical protein
MTLVEQYSDLVNHKLPEAARRDRRYPVRFNHCFARIILDNVCGCEWYQVISKPAYKNMTTEQLECAIALGKQYLEDPDLCVTANEKSLAFRGKQSRTAKR